MKTGRQAMYRRRAWLAACVGAACGGAAWAGPEGGEIVSGAGTISRPGNGTTTVTQHTDRLGIDWESFDVGENESVRFDQPSSGAAALNRILDQNPSRILGALDANGHVYLINPNGMVFGESARINVASLIASSLDLSLDDFMAGNYDFEALDGEAGLVVNRGVIAAATGGSVTLLGGAVSNEGLIVADLGRVNLGAGRRASLDFDGDGLLYFEVDDALVSNPDGRDSAVSNAGEIRADGGEVVLSARAAQDVFTNVVNNEGTVRAARIDDSGGTIRLVGSGANVVNSGTLDARGAGGAGGTVQVLGDRVGLFGDARVNVSGDTDGGVAQIGGGFQGLDPDVMNAQRTYVGADAQVSADAGAVGDGGEVVVWADGITRFLGEISARGGAQRGDGGSVEVSGKEDLVFRGRVDASAADGRRGTLLLDPEDVTISNDEGGGGGPHDDDEIDGDGELEFGDPGNDATITAGALEALAADVSISIQATNSIVVEDLTADGKGGIDNELTLASDISVEFLTGAGGFEMLDTDDVIRLSGGGSLRIDAIGATSGGVGDGAVIVGGIETSGGDVTLSGATLTSGFITSTGGDVSLISSGDITSGTLTGGGGSTLSIEQGDPLNWNLTGDGAGDVDVLGGATSFTGFEHLAGGSQDDVFSLSGAASLGGTLDGGAGSDTLDLAGLAAALGVVLDGVGGMDGFEGAVSGLAGLVARFDNVDALIGGGAGDSLTGPDSANDWTLDGENAGSLMAGGETLAFSGIGNVVGGAGADTFVLQTADFDGDVDGGAGNDVFDVDVAQSGTLDGGAGTDALDLESFAAAVDFVLDGIGGPDGFEGAVAGLVAAFDDINTLIGGSGADDSLTGADVANDWTLDGPHAGSLASGGATLGFSGIENAVGGADVDAFTFETDDFQGDAHGGAGDDTFHAVVAQSGTLDGGAGSDTLTGSNANSTWTLDGANQGTVQASGLLLTFLGLEDLVGGTGNDDFTIAGAASLSGTADGGAGANTLTGADLANDWTLDAADGGAVVSDPDGAANAVAFAGMSSVQGGAQADAFALEADFGGNVSGAAGDDTFHVDVAQTGNLAGGAGNDLVRLQPGVTVGALGGGATGTDDDTLVVLGGNNDWFVTGPDAGNVNGQAFADFENLTGSDGIDTFQFNDALTGTASGGDGDDLFVMRNGGSFGGVSGGAGTDLLTFALMTAAATVSIDGLDVETVAGSAFADTLQGTPGDDGFVTTGANAVTVGGVQYESFEHLDGLAGADVFDLGHDMSGNVTGGAGQDTINLAAGVTIGGSLIGGSGQDTLAFTGAAGTWNVTGIGAGSVDSQAFGGIEVLQGGAMADIFNLGADASIAVAGGGGTDTIVADPATATVFTVDSPDAGVIDNGSGTVTFTSTENLTGGDLADTFHLDASLGGTAAGGAGDDTFRLGGAVSATVDGGAGDDALFGSDGGTTFTVTGADSGAAARAGESVGFSGIERLFGGIGADVFTVNAGFSGTLDAGAGNDIFDVNAAFGGTASGGDGDDTFHVNDDVTGALAGDAGSDRFDLAEGVSAALLSGGAGADTIAAAPDAAATFAVGAQNAGNVESGAGSAAFSSIEHLEGSGLADTFDLGADVTGSVAGLGGDDTFNLDADVTGALDGGAGDDTFNVGAGASAGVSGGAGADAVAADAAATFTTTGPSAGTVVVGTGAVDFQDVEELRGSGEADTFHLGAAFGGTASGLAGDDVFALGAGATASVAGGAGSDALQGSDSDTAFDITDADSGSASSGGGAVDFSSIESVTGGAGDDAFALADAAIFTGALDGGAGANVLDWSAYASAREVTLTGSGANGFAGSESSVAGGFANIGAIAGSSAGADVLRGIDGDALWAIGGNGGNGGHRYTAGGPSLTFDGFTTLIGGSGADTFALATGTYPGGLRLEGGGGADGALIDGEFTVAGDLALAAIETVTAADGDSLLSARALAIDGASGGIGSAQAPLVVSLATLNVTDSGTGLHLLQSSGDLTVERIAIGHGDVSLAVQTGDPAQPADLIVGYIDAGGTSGDPMTPPAAGDGGAVTLSVARGSVRNGNGGDVNVRSASATIQAPRGDIGAPGDPITIVVASDATIRLAAIDAQISNPSLARVDDSLVSGLFSDVTANATAAAVGASTVSALQDVAAIDWAGLDPNVALVDCLEPCVALPADQSEDDGFAVLREADKLLLIRTSDGWKLIPVFERRVAVAAH